MPKIENDKDKRKVRRRNHIAKDLVTSPLYRAKAVQPALTEDEQERRIRRYGYGIDDE